jgi:hypothetical protein
MIRNSNDILQVALCIRVRSTPPSQQRAEGSGTLASAGLYVLLLQLCTRHSGWKNCTISAPIFALLKVGTLIINHLQNFLHRAILSQSLTFYPLRFTRHFLHHFRTVSAPIFAFLKVGMLIINHFQKKLHRAILSHFPLTLATPVAQIGNLLYRRLSIGIRNSCQTTMNP